eukprot:TRINITY_DN25875_c0_g1_i1.p2 TRINITY_DN25875_c0_g1~~TRINITY_DN25875_c0_g1_i1.p2  ORF type:complete len:272 (-),score=59.51 TRINITY_DN25875_c0_g1_i1:789-1604(-)
MSLPMDLSSLGLKRPAEGSAGAERAPKAGKGQTKSGIKAKKEEKEEQQTKPNRGGAARGGAQLAGDKAMQELIVNVAKLGLGSARRVATLDSVVLTTLTFDKSAEPGLSLVEALKEVTSDYTTMAKELPQEQKQFFAAPHVFTWLGLLTFVAQQYKDEPTNPNLVQIAEHLQEMNNQSTKQCAENKELDPQKNLRDLVQSEIFVCRVSRTWNPKVAKMELHAAPSTRGAAAVRAVQNFLLQKCGAQLRRGPAPKSDLERRIQATLNAIAER